MRTSAPVGPNLFDGGPTSKPTMNPQPSNNALYSQQEMNANIVSQSQQAQSDAIQGQRLQSVSLSNEEAKAQSYAATRIAEALYANDAGSALLKLNQIAQSPEKTRFENDQMVSSAMSLSVNPDLGAYAASTQQYS